MNEYTASNGIKVTVEDNHVKFTGNTPSSPVWFGDGEVQALREFFRAERDEELGRWRSDSDPNWTAVLVEDVKVVEFRHDDGVHTFNVHAELKNMSSWTPALQAIGREYFAAHPEPKPWHDAKIGELWDVTTANQEDVRCFVVHDEPFSFVTADTTHHKPDSIIAATRIYPPADPT